LRTLSNIWAVFLRELTAFFFAPVAYVVVFVFVLSCGTIFYLNCVSPLQFYPQQITKILGSLFSFAVFWVLPVSPLLTMRLFAEERRSGTIEMLMTTPVTEFQVVAGKFLATQVFYMLIWSTVLLFVLLLQSLGNPDWGPVWAIYIGLFFLGLLTNSLGLLASALSRNQLVAAVLALSGNLAFLIVHLGTWIFYDSAELQRFFEYLSFSSHFRSDFALGIVDLRYLGYYSSLSVLFLFFSVRVVEANKWR